MHVLHHRIAADVRAHEICLDAVRALSARTRDRVPA
jgi:hypothetical protein